MAGHIKVSGCLQYSEVYRGTRLLFAIMNEEDPKPLNLQINLQAFNVFFSLFSFPFYSEGFGGED